MIPSDLRDLLALADLCQNRSAPLTARELVRYFERSVEDAQSSLYRQAGFAGSSSESNTSIDEDLRVAGWVVEDHPRFVGRDYVFKAFNEFLSAHSTRGGVFVVQASAGLGKTALLTELIRRSDRDRAGFYFRYRDNRVDPKVMSKTIWDQLGKRYGLPPEEVPVEAQFTGKLEERLRTIATTKLGPTGQLHLFIDALDEAEQPEKAVALIPKSLPARVFVVTSSRPPSGGADHLAGLKQAGAEVLVLDEHTAENERDIAEFLVGIAAHAPGPDESVKLAEATGGSFMLATLFAEALIQGEQKPGDLLVQAKDWAGLDSTARLFGYYGQCWARACKLVDESALGDLAAHLAAALNWMSEKKLAEILVWADRRRDASERLWRGATFKKAEAALSWMLDHREWEKAGHAAEFLQLRHQTAREFVVNLRHQSARDFIVGNEGPAWQGLEGTHGVIAEFYLNEAEKKGWDNVDPYGRWYVVRHLIRQTGSEAIRRAATVLSTPAYLQATLGTESTETQ